MDCLFKILSSKVLWATHFSHLNDTSEFYYSLEHISNAVYQGLKVNHVLYPSLDEIREVLKIKLYAGLEKGFFITSFCEISMQDDEGILSMWRSYGNDGCYIEFDTKLIYDYLKQFSISGVFDAVIYDKTLEGEQEQKERMDMITNLVIKLYEGKEQQDVLLPFANLATMLKHPKFYEEREIRLAILNTIGQNQCREVNCCHGKQYVTWPFSPESIQKIVVGPHIDQCARIDKINQILQSYSEFKHVMVIGSAIPYREWHWTHSEEESETEVV